MATNTAPKTDTAPAGKGTGSDIQFEEVDDVYAEPWKDPNKGDFIIGEYLGVREIKGERGTYFNAHVLRKLDQTLISVAGGSLEARIARIPIGTTIRVEYQGMQNHKGNKMKLFKVDAEKGTRLLPITFKSRNSDNDDNIPF